MVLKLPARVKCKIAQKQCNFLEMVTYVELLRTRASAAGTGPPSTDELVHTVPDTHPCQQAKGSTYSCRKKTKRFIYRSDKLTLILVVVVLLTLTDGASQVTGSLPACQVNRHGGSTNVGTA